VAVVNISSKGVFSHLARRVRAGPFLLLSTSSEEHPQIKTKLIYINTVHHYARDIRERISEVRCVAILRG